MIDFVMKVLPIRPTLLVGLLCTFVAGGADLTDVVVLQTTDIHGFITYSDVDTEGAGGWLRIATLIERQRRRHGRERVLLIDCGDTVSGCIDAVPSGGNIAVEMLKALNYDVWVPGNHELDFGSRRCAEFCRAAGDRVLCGNLVLRPEPDADDIRFPAWRMFDKGGARIAVIGMSASYVRHWYWGDAAKGFEAYKAVDAITRVIGDIRAESPDAVILAIHQGWLPKDTRGVNEVSEIVRQFPEIDVILGGHTHWAHAGRKLGGRTWYVQSGKHADALAVVRISVNTTRHKVVAVESERVLASADIPQMVMPETKLAGLLEQLQAFRSHKVGELGRRVSAGETPGIDSDSSELISAAIAGAAGTKIVVHGKLSDDDFAEGTFTEADLFRLVPYENTVGVLTLSPGQLVDIINEQIAMRDSYVVNGLWGVYAVAGDGGMVEHLVWPDGGEVDTTIKVAFNSYSLGGGGGRFPVLKRLANTPSCRAFDTGLSTRDIVRKYIRRHSPVTVTPRNWFLPPE